ncbi:hypothetical protein DBV15_04241 [Temnothorax longispinosus]|uniref:Uncharacterized protein n=1 Tax=Temnothorax longispinosus TaxID=300112 RepID=A0A4S2KQX6_9HYME|nr:hypothetical protein DBV15_04241 [Temnothorax longispinosus]
MRNMIPTAKRWVEAVNLAATKVCAGMRRLQWLPSCRWNANGVRRTHPDHVVPFSTPSRHLDNGSINNQSATIIGRANRPNRSRQKHGTTAGWLVDGDSCQQRVQFYVSAYEHSGLTGRGAARSAARKGEQSPNVIQKILISDKRTKYNRILCGSGSRVLAPDVSANNVPLPLSRSLSTLSVSNTWHYYRSFAV